MLNKQFNHILVQIVIAVIVILSALGNAYANDLEELVETGQLRLTVTVKDQDSIIAKQPVIIQLQIATNRWFAGGVNTSPIEMTDIVVLANNELVINGSERINGQTWATQLREITFYPMKPGTYALPPIAVSIAVNQESGVDAVGTLYTKPLTFNVNLPEELHNIDQYVISSEFTIEVEGGLDQINDAQVGNAITQTVTFKGTNVPAMMLPQVAVEQLPGISIYKKPPILSDKSNRGTSIGTRQESLTYFFEQAGEYTLKEQQFYWWNTDIQQLETITIPEINWTVNDGSSSFISKLLALKLTNNNFSNISSLIILLIGSSVLISVTVFIIRNRNSIIYHYKVFTRHEYRKQKQLFINAIKSEKYQLACQHLYRIIGLDENESNTLEEYFNDSKEKQQLLNKLLILAYKIDTHEGKQLAKFTVQQGKTLLINIKMRNTGKSVNIDDYIRLN